MPEQKVSNIMKYLLTLLVSMVPIIELRGAIPFGVGMGLPWQQVVLISMIGNMLPVPVIFFFARRVLEWGADKPVIGKFFSWCLKKGHHGGEKLRAKAGKGMFWALLLFVGIPLPGTGAWTGTLAASLLDLEFKKSVVAIMLGVMLAALIITVLTLLGFGAYFGLSNL
ncbi:MAG: small multi-drug export protein [Oscillospiraceae bacterium]|nr:small multi-drug export protein [Oscillospiraceae bacterium]